MKLSLTKYRLFGDSWSSTSRPRLLTMQNGHARNLLTLFTSFPDMYLLATLFVFTVDAGNGHSRRSRR